MIKILFFILGVAIGIKYSNFITTKIWEPLKAWFKSKTEKKD